MPPPAGALFRAIVVLVSVAVPKLAMAPPVVVAVFDDSVESRTESVPVASLAMAPPVPAVLPSNVSLLRDRVPKLSTAPPRLAVPPAIVSAGDRGGDAGGDGQQPRSCRR